MARTAVSHLTRWFWIKVNLLKSNLHEKWTGFICWRPLYVAESDEEAVSVAEVAVQDFNTAVISLAVNHVRVFSGWGSCLHSQTARRGNGCA